MRAGQPGRRGCRVTNLVLTPQPRQKTPVAWAVAAIVVLGFVAVVATRTSVMRAAELCVVAILVVVVGYLANAAGSTALVCATIVSEVFTSPTNFGLRFSPDRFLIAAALGVFAVEAYHRRHARQITWRLEHALIAATLALVVLSSWAFGTLFTRDGVFAILDRLGAVPFLMFTIAPLVFGDERQRRLLLKFLVVLGAYLGLTAVFEGIGLHALVFPKYILQRGVGYQYGRARGPFVESVADGLGLFECGVACFMSAHLWRGRAFGRFSFLVGILCTLATAFTLTRAIWLGTAIAIVVTGLVVAPLRRFLGPIVVVAGLGVLALVVALPAFHTAAQARTGAAQATRSVWDRLNTDRAAVRVAERHPLVGIGWQTFITKGGVYQVQAPTYPITTGDIEVHNVFLSHTAELGILGATLWILALLMVVGRALRRPSDPALWPWRVGLVAVVVDWAVVANFGPVVYPFTNLLLWLWPGIVLVDYLSVRRPSGAKTDPQVPSR
jgi:putative inorganic carbon (HCO3(-)) transporter